MTELPDIKSIRTGSKINGSNYAECVFTNGAMLRYVREPSPNVDGEYRIEQEIFAPSDPHSVMECAVVNRAPTDETPAECLVESLEFYGNYSSVDELMQDWSLLAEWILHE